MATRFLTLEEAANELGITPEELNELRQRQDIYGYRDGASWKFKEEEVERLREKRANSTDEPTVDSDEIVLMSEFELGDSGPSPSSTVIGQSIPGVEKKESSESDLKIGGSELDLQLGDSSLNIGQEPKPADAPLMSDVRLASDSEIGLAPASDINPVSDSGLPIDLSEESANEDVTQLGLVESGISLSDDISLTEEPQPGSGIRLGEEDEDVLGGPASGSDITHRPSDSGILLIDPGDSGLSLDQAPLDLTGGSDAPTTDFAALDDSTTPGDDDFLLTTLDDSAEDESDSGSQVIMLDTEGEFDDATATLLGSQMPGSEASLDSAMGLGAAAGRGAARGGPQPAPIVVVQRESPFTPLSIVGLAACVLVLTLTGMMMFDLIRNMWSWDGPYSLNSSLMDTLLGR